VRILIVSHPPLSAELGAAQVAINLAAALSERGHDVRTWSPEPLAASSHWWNRWLAQRRAIEHFAAAQGPFDAIDTPAISASRRLARCGSLIVRSVQPELQYLFHGVRSALGHGPSPAALAQAALAGPQACAILDGWRSARAILCLGSHELAWMRRRFPRWQSKLGLYFNALAPAERPALAEVRRRRGRLDPTAVRFLWIGRWTAHKGTRRLVRFLAKRISTSPRDTFTLAGCGTLAERDMHGEWVRRGRVKLVPSFTRAELPSLLAAHEAGLFTSDLEGWGLSLIEMLESGMMVFATEAGAVADLRPFFPASLRPFPPPPVIAAKPQEDLDGNGYYQTFSWHEIACAYERQALACLQGGE
jgi:glycosyltransferase involved in cell wall biosynthesis